MDRSGPGARVFRAALAAGLALVSDAQADPFFSEYVEGSGHDKALEIYSAGGFDLGANGCQVRMYFNGSSSPGTTVGLSGSIAAGDVFVLAQSGAALPAILAEADQLDGSSWYNGNDAVELFCSSTGSVDVVGQIGFDPGGEWGSGDTSTANNTLRRSASVTAGDTNGADSFDPSLQWSGFPQDDVADLGRFGSGGGGTLACDSPEIVAIGSVQGTGDATPVPGLVRAVRGVVVADYEGASPELRGFYLQDAGDADPLSSDGIFVFNGNADSVSLGQDVAVRGTVSEFFDQTQLGGSLEIVDCGSAALPTAGAFTLPLPAPVGGVDFLERYEGMRVTIPQTLVVTEHFQLGRFGQLTLSSGDRLDQPTQVSGPGAPANAVRAANELNRIVIDDRTQDQNRFPVLFPTRPPPGVSGLSPSNTVRGGDPVTHLTGVLSYTWGGNGDSPNAWRLRFDPGEEPHFGVAKPRPSSPPAVGGNLVVASFNVLNYFTTIDTGAAICGPPGNLQRCRGADDATELSRQRQKLLAALARLDADIVGLVELENNTGSFATSAVKDLADRLSAAGGSAGCSSYAAVDPGGFVGTDVIQVGFLYCADTVQVAPGTTPAILDDAAVALIGAPGVTLPVFDGPDTNRASLAVSFESLVTGETLTVVNNHFKSKGDSGLEGPCAGSPAFDPNCDQGDGQGFWNPRRVDAARSVIAWLLTSFPTGSPDLDFLILGDLNAYRFEDPLGEFATAGFLDLLNDASSDAYSFVFDGEWGTLDYALASPSLMAVVTGVATDPIDADEPLALDYDTTFNDPSLFAPDAFRASDHDPLLVGLMLGSACDGSPTPDRDGDGRSDACEEELGTDPDVADSDGDGLLDGVETGTGDFVDAGDTGTDPLDPDSDGDGVEDGDEVAAGSDPNDPDSRPAIPALSVLAQGLLFLALCIAAWIWGRRDLRRRRG